jgi:predicted DNA-binding protein (UPF0251 family)
MAKPTSPRGTPRPEGAGARGPKPGEGGAPAVEFTAQQIEQIESMANIGCTQAEMAATLGISEDTLQRRLHDTSAVAEAVRRGDARLKRSLRRKKVEIALRDGHHAQAKMLIWCSKTILGESDRRIVKLETEKDALDTLRELFPDIPADDLALLAGEKGVH